MKKANKETVVTGQPDSKESITPVQIAEADLARYQKAASELEAEIQDKEKALAEAETASGDQILSSRLDGDGDASNRILNDLTKLKTSTDITRRALVSARRAVVKAEAGVLQAQAGVKRERVAELLAEIKERQAHVAELLAPLQEYEGVPFVHMPRINPATGQLEAGPASKTQFLLVEMIGIENEAKQLEDQARRIRTRPAPVRDDEILHL